MHLTRNREVFKSRNQSILVMALSNVQAEQYKKVFADYPWNSLVLALERGAIEMIDSKDMEMGQIYIIARKNQFGSGLRSMKITTDLLSYQLSSILRQDNSQYSINKILRQSVWQFKNFKEQIYDNEYMKLIEKYGLDYKPSIDFFDTFIMACYFEEKTEEKEGKRVDIGYNNLRKFLETVGSNRDLDYLEKIQNTEASDNYQKSIKEIARNRLLRTVGSDGYISSPNEIDEWAYVFKIQLKKLSNDFMNWEKIPF